jgi:hypothetical protein
MAFVLSLKQHFAFYPHVFLGCFIIFWCSDQLLPFTTSACYKSAFLFWVVSTVSASWFLFSDYQAIFSAKNELEIILSFETPNQKWKESMAFIQFFKAGFR